MSSTGKKILIGILVFAGIIIIAIVVALWRAGMFAEPEIYVAERGPWHYVYTARTGSFKEIPKVFEEVNTYLDANNIDYGIGCGAYLDDPSKVEQENMRWRAGYLVKDSVQVDDPYVFETIPRQNFVVAAIDAHPMIAPIKTYPAINKWVAENDYAVKDHAYELYQEDGMIEVLFPVSE